MELVKFLLKKSETNNWNREELLHLGMTDCDIPMVLKMLKNLEDFDVTEDQWIQAVDKALELRERKVHLLRENELQTVSDPNYRLKIDPDIAHNYWNQYKEHLENSIGLESTIMVEASCENILRRLTNSPGGTVKGLVHESVQSGKTANMEGLIAKAADYNFNVFIVFTGTIITLNDQTESRFRNDLSGSFQYTILSSENLDKQLINPASRTVCVTMKTAAKIKLVIKWLTKYSHREKLKVLIIDDEADYASVDSSRDGVNRTKTNKLLMNLVNQKDVNGKPLNIQYGAMNYLAYTATPYANLLNEESVESLYPRDFITSIPHSDSYFGPQQIFGCNTGVKDYPGLPIVNTSADLDSEFKKLEKGLLDVPTEDLKESLAWFISAVAALRFKGYKKPLTMMVNTSQNVDPHENVGRVIVDYLDSKMYRSELLKYCEIIYNRECRNFTKEIFRENYPDYPSELYDSTRDYPSFEEILPFMEELLSENCRHIESYDDGVKYHRSIHVCIEDSKDTVVAESDPEAIAIPRIRYPKEGDECPDAPAFIVVGGNVLSRGLTLEGLISTFFLRSVSGADTLMQMGRWFGFRRGYELYPRIWMSYRSYEDYSFLAELDEELRDEIKRCNAAGENPSRTAIRLLAIPKASERGYLKSLSSKNKTKGMITSDISFIDRYEEFATFADDYEVLNSNLELTKGFLNGLENYGPEIPEDDNWNVVRWKNVPTRTILDNFLNDFSNGPDPKVKRTFILDSLIKWLETMDTNGVLQSWNVLLAGTRYNDKDKVFEVNDKVHIGKIERSKEQADYIQIKTLRNRSDLFKDVFPTEFEDRNTLGSIRKGNLSTDLRIHERDTEWVGKHPLMVIYCIDRNSKHSGTNTHKVDLNSKQDIIAFLVEIPNIGVWDKNRVCIKLDTSRLSEDEFQ